MKATAASGREGAILAAVMVMLVLAGGLCAGLLHYSSAGALESSKWISLQQAFWNAEAGMEEAKARAYQNKTLWHYDRAFPASQPRAWSNTTSRGRFAVDIVEETGPTPSYQVTAEGWSPGGARAAVQLTIRQLPAIAMGVFGDEALSLQPNQQFLSYHASLDPQPTASNSTGEASIGSNQLIELSPNLLLDGTLYLGADSNDTPAAIVGGDTNLLATQQIGYTDPDPLGVIDGELADAFLAAATDNDNAAVTAIHNDRLLIGNNRVAYFPPGDYYLTDIEIRGDLIVSNGPVNIYLSGEARAWPGSQINVDGLPGNLRLYSNSTEPINLQPNGDLRAFVYAPLAESISIKPGNNYYGVVWGRNVALQPHGQAWIDRDLLEYGAFSTYRLGAQAWRRLPRMW